MHLGFKLSYLKIKLLKILFSFCIHGFKRCSVNDYIVHFCRIREIPELFQNIPFQAMECLLVGVQPLGLVTSYFDLTTSKQYVASENCCYIYLNL